MAEPAAKRQRVDEIAAPLAPVVSTAPPVAAPPFLLTPDQQATLSSWLDMLRPEDMRALLHSAASTQPAAYALVQSSVVRLQQQQQPQPKQLQELQQQQQEVPPSVPMPMRRAVDFSRHSEGAIYEMTERYADMSSSAQFEAAFDVEAAVERTLDEIVGECSRHIGSTTSVGGGGVPYETKWSAVCAVRDILEGVLDASEEIGRELRNGAAGSSWDKKLAKIVFDCMGEGELERLVFEDDGAWVEKVRRLRNEANGYSIFEGLAEVVDFFGWDTER